MDLTAVSLSLFLVDCRIKSIGTLIHLKASFGPALELSRSPRPRVFTSTLGEVFGIGFFLWNQHEIMLFIIYRGRKLQHLEVRGEKKMYKTIGMLGGALGVFFAPARAQVPSSSIIFVTKLVVSLCLKTRWFLYFQISQTTKRTRLRTSFVGTSFLLASIFHQAWMF